MQFLLLTARAHLSLIAAAGAGLAGMTGIQTPGYAHTSAVTSTGTHGGSTSHLTNNPTSSSSSRPQHPQAHSSSSRTPHGSTHQLSEAAHSSHHFQQQPLPPPPQHSSNQHSRGGVTAQELDAFLRQAQRNGRCHIRTLGTLAVANLLCWVPLYVCALVAPVGK